MSEYEICDYWRTCKKGVSEYECKVSICVCRNDLPNEYEPKKD